MRAFIAVPCPETLRDEFMGVQAEIQLYGKMRPVDRGNIHLTLKFLGEVDEVRLGVVKEGLGFLSDVEKFRAWARGVGVFPSIDYMKVIWVGVGEGSAEIRTVQSEIDEGLDKQGFSRDRRFHSHFTLARVKSVSEKEKLRGFIEGNSRRVFGEFKVDRIMLMGSRLTPKGPRYSVVEEFLLK
ncbi:MAG: RNA 2',3'-cyclic phosphodiesterase [Candidatus Altiarchaeales archaeon]|nr:RNA 2',3'-cyclic phosphodiesterase [Candidatus Altiarchaeales archaeon]